MSNKQKIHNSLVNFGLTDDEYTAIREKVVYSNFKNLEILGAVGTILLLILSISSLVMNNGLIWIPYTIAFVLCAISWILNFLFTKKNIDLLKYFVYISVFSFIALGIVVGTVFEKDDPAVSFICYLLILPIIFTERPYRLLLSQILFIVSYLIFAFLFKNPSTLYVDIINVLLFGFASIVVTLFLGKMKIQGFLNEYKVNELAHKDPLTGIKNRTSYEEMLPKYKDLCKTSLSCIYVDLNGLHEENNNKGHNEGDKMIIAVGNAIKSVVGAEHIYRTGGDEFVSFIIDKEYQDVKGIKEEIIKKINETSYSASVGGTFVKKDELDIHELVSKAEILMYENKDKYYASIGENARK